MGLPGKRVVFRELNAGGRRKDRVKIERRWVRREELRVFEEARREWLCVFEDSERIQLRKMKRNRRGVVGAVGQVTQESCVVRMSRSFVQVQAQSLWARLTRRLRLQLGE